MAYSEGLAGTTKRPASVWACIALLVFLGVSAIGGGLAMLFDLGGASPPLEWLESVPLVDSWVLPGLVLLVGFGLGSLVAAWGMLGRPNLWGTDWIERSSGHHWSWLATIVIGVGQMVWIGLELIYLPDVAWLQVVYGTVGIALASLPWLPSARDHLRMSEPARIQSAMRPKISADPI